MAIRSALVPAAQPARGWRDEEGAIFVDPLEPLARGAKKKLEEAGVEIVDVAPPKNATQARTWAELVSFVPTAIGELDRVLFLVANPRALLDLASELLRLGCDRQELRRAGDLCMLRATAPPYYAIARALDGELRAFLPGAQEGAWCEIGWAHPLADLVRAETGTMLLLSPRGWTSIPEGEWTDLHALVDLEVPKDTRAYEAKEIPRLPVSLRLERGRVGDIATLWVIRENAIQAIEKIVTSVPEPVLQGFLFAMAGDIAIVRARPSLDRVPEIEIPGEAYRAHAQIPNLFVPRGSAIEPPIRAETLRSVLAPNPNALFWCMRGDKGIAVEHIDEDALVPISDFVEYVIDRASELQGWVKGASFDFSSFEVADPDFSTGPKSRKPKSERERRPREEEPEEEKPAPRLRAIAIPDAPVSAVPISAPASRQPLLEELAKLEREFIALDAASDDPAREPLWMKMAELHAQLDHRRDAGLCFTRAMWESQKPDPIAKAWAAAESTGMKLDAYLSLKTPTRDDVRAVCALVSADKKIDPSRVIPWLDQHDRELDVRSFWLARHALSRAAGGDRLSLARARDRILQELAKGLSIERDVPAFLRFLGGARDPSQLRKLAARLDNLAKKYEKTKRKAAMVEADPKLTLAYVLFVIGWGFARLAQHEKSRSLSERALTLLPVKDPVHDILSSAWRARIAQALEGLPAETPLPADIAAKLGALDAFARYKVDRARQHSQILEPQEKLDPARAFQRGEKDPRGPELEPLRAMTSGPELEEAVARIVDQAARASLEDRARLYDGVMDFFPAIRSEMAKEHLARIVSTVGEIPTKRRAQLLEEALMLAAHVGDADLVRRIFALLRAIVTELDEGSIAEVAPLLGTAMRTLRRVGLKEEASELLGALERASRHTQTARLHAAGALAYLGNFALAKPIFDEARKVMSGEMKVPERLDLTRAFARSVAAAPHEYATNALDALSDSLVYVTDGFNTNTHLCISVVAFVEAIVLGYVSDDLGMGDLGRQWLDDDEYFVRRRIHRDMTT